MGSSSPVQEAELILACEGGEENLDNNPTSSTGLPSSLTGSTQGRQGAAPLSKQVPTSIICSGECHSIHPGCSQGASLPALQLKSRLVDKSRGRGSGMLVSSCLPSGCFPPAHMGCGGCPECGCSPGTMFWAGLLAQDPGPPQWRLLLEWEALQLHWPLPLHPQGLSQPGEIIFTPWAAPCLAWCACNAGFTCPLLLGALRVPG